MFFCTPYFFADKHPCKKDITFQAYSEFIKNTRIFRLLFSTLQFFFLFFFKKQLVKVLIPETGVSASLRYLIQNFRQSKL